MVCGSAASPSAPPPLGVPVATVTPAGGPSGPTPIPSMANPNQPYAPPVTPRDPRWDPATVPVAGPPTSLPGATLPTSAPERRGPSAVLVVAVVAVVAVLGLVAGVVLGGRGGSDAASTDGGTSIGEVEPSGSDPSDGNQGASSTPEPTTTTSSTSTTTTAPRSPEEIATDGLREAVAAGAPIADGIIGQWVPQLASKKPDVELRDGTFSKQYILDEYLGLKARYPDAILLWSDAYSSWRKKGSTGFYITLLPRPMGSKDAVRSWCAAEGLGTAQCLAQQVDR